MGGVSRKVLTGRVLTGVNVAFACVHVFVFWAPVVGLSTANLTWAELPFLLGPPVALLAFVVTAWRPKQPLATPVNGVFFLLYAAIWIPVLMSRGFM